MHSLLLLASTLVVASAPLPRGVLPYKVHPFPGGDTIASPHYAVLVRAPPTVDANADADADADADPSFVWYTSVANRQPILPGNNVPQTDRRKSTSFASFDVSGPTQVTVVLLQNASATTTAVTATTATVLPTAAGIVARIAPDQRSVSLTIDAPRQVCIVINGDMDVPLCIFADPPEVGAPKGPSTKDLIYFGPGVHRIPGDAINVTENKSVYLAGGAHVYGQVRAVGVRWDGFWDGGYPCDNVKVFGRGVLDGHDIPINYAAHAMIELPNCSNIVVEGITTIDSPQYQINNEAPGGRVRYAKAIAWGFTTDGWSGPCEKSPLATKNLLEVTLRGATQSISALLMR